MMMADTRVMCMSARDCSVTQVVLAWCCGNMTDSMLPCPVLTSNQVARSIKQRLQSECISDEHACETYTLLRLPDVSGVC
jgi:hypothetical protein